MSDIDPSLAIFPSSAESVVPIPCMLKQVVVLLHFALAMNRISFALSLVSI